MPEAVLNGCTGSIRKLAFSQSGKLLAAASDAGLPRIFELESEYEERVLTAELSYVKALVQEMADGTLEGLDMWRLFQTEDFDPEEVHFTFELPKE